MTILEHLLECLSEECSEVAKDISKSLRFGLEDKPPEDCVAKIDPVISNHDRICLELNQLVATVRLLRQMGILKFREDKNVQMEKVFKIQKWMGYGIDQNTVTPEGFVSFGQVVRETVREIESKKELI